MAGTFELLTRFRSMLPFLGFHHIVMMLLAMAICFFSFVLSACTSSTATSLGLYLTHLSYQPVPHSSSPEQVNPDLVTTFATLVNGSSLEVRAGYFRLCVRYSGEKWVCSSDATGLARQFQPYQDPLNLIWAQARFREKIIFSGLIIAAIALAFIAFCLLLTFPGWHEELEEVDDDNDSEREVKPFPSRPLSELALAASTLASMFALVSMLWQHTASVAAATTAQDLGYGTVRSEVGATALALGWAGLALMALVAMCLLVMILSIRILDQLTDE